MDIYSIGTEKCIDGVWGREVNGRFYTYVKGDDTSCMYRKLDVNTTGVSYFAQRSCVASNNYEYVASNNYEYVVSNMYNTLCAYAPKHIKDLENLKYGDVVWVRKNTDDNWAITVFLEVRDGKYITCPYFYSNGGSRGFISSVYVSEHSEVFLKPPFDF